MFISEQGWKYTEKITFDMTKKTVVHQVPPHRSLNESNVMDDFVSVRNILARDHKLFNKLIIKMFK